MAFPTSRLWSDVVWMGDKFVAVTFDSTYVAHSDDGVSWTEYDCIPNLYGGEYDVRHDKIIWNGSKLLTIESGRSVCISTDGINWTLYFRALPASATWMDVTWDGSQFIAVGRSTNAANPNVATSSDGITWTNQKSGVMEHFNVAWNGTYIVTHQSGLSGYWHYSTSGTSWATKQIVGNTQIGALAAVPSGVFVALHTNGDAVYILKTDLTRTSSTMPVSARWKDILFGSTRFAAIATEVSGYTTTVAATVSSDGLTTNSATLPVAARWQALAYGDGRFVAIAYGTATAVSDDDGQTWTVSGALIGFAEAPTALTVQVPQIAEAPTALDVVNVTGVAVAATRCDVHADGIAEAACELAVIDVSGPHTRWSAGCSLGGADVSDRLIGTVRVTATEGAARIAECTIMAPSGVIHPLDYVGRNISLSYRLHFGEKMVAIRLFTGVVDTPSYDCDLRAVHLRCVDDLQNRVAALERAVIDSLVGGYYSVGVQGEIDDNWEYAQARLSTVAGSLDCDAHGALRVTEWVGGAALASFTDGDLLYRRSSIDYPQRSRIINAVTAVFEYRYPRLRQRSTSIGWSGTINDMARSGFQYPTQQEIMSAASGAGWSITSAVFYPAPAAIPHASGGFIKPPKGSVDLAVLYLKHRHGQTVTERYTIIAASAESVALNGELPSQLHGALESAFDSTNWESALDIPPLNDGGNAEIDYSPDVTRADSENALNTLIAQARVRILGSHRGARVTNATPCNPMIDLNRRISVDAGGITASGKVFEVVHELDIDAGHAITEFTLACFGCGGTGIPSPSPEPPEPPESTVDPGEWAYDVPPLVTATYGGTPYQEGLMGLLLNPAKSISVEDIPPDGHSETFDNPWYVDGTYPVQGFRVRMPGVDDGLRNPVVKDVVTEIDVVVPSDTMYITN